MKRLMMAFTLCLVSVAMFGQLNFGGGGNAKKVTSFYKDGFGEIKISEEKYVVEVKDITQKEGTFKMFLGNDAESAKESLGQIIAWCKGAAMKDYIEVNQEDGTTVVLYMFKNGQLILSYGDIDYVTEKFNSLVNNKKMTKKDQPFGYMLVVAFERALEKMEK